MESTTAIEGRIMERLCRTTKLGKLKRFLCLCFATSSQSTKETLNVQKIRPTLREALGDIRDSYRPVFLNHSMQQLKLDEVGN
jgi:hypothetical protein